MPAESCEDYISLVILIHRTVTKNVMLLMPDKAYDVNVQFLRFLRRTEGVEAARKYFLDARKSPNCTYHVYVAYAMMAFCLDKDAKVIRDSKLGCRVLCLLLVHRKKCYSHLILICMRV